MEFEIISKDEVLEIAISGDLDINSSNDMRNKLLKEYQMSKKDIVLDLARLEYLDSTGIGALIAVYKEIDDGGNKITIVNPQKNILKLFQITDLLDVFNIE